MKNLKRSPGALTWMIKTVRASLFIRNKRFRKKLHMNMMGLKVLFDLTTMIYSLFLVAYLVAAFFIANDAINASYDFFIMMEDRARDYFWFILAVLPFRYIMQSFQWPGIIFSTSEYKLSALPYARGNVWLFASMMKLSRNLLMYVIVGALFILVTPISSSLITGYLTILFGYDILFTVPIWKLFHERAIIKWASLGGALLMSVSTYLLDFPFIGLIIPLVLVVLHIVLIPQLFDDINWGRVTEVSDFKIWNMPLVSRATKSTYQRSKRYSIFRRSKRRKRAFKYTHQAIHHRLWLIYLGKNFSLILQLAGGLLVMLSVLAFMKDFYFHVGIALSIYIYLNVCTSFFRDRFQTDILRALPWDLYVYKRTFMKWVVYGASVPFIPILIYGVVHWSTWEPVKWVLYGCVFYYTYHVKMDKAIIVISKRLLTLDVSETAAFLFLVLIVGTGFYPALSLGLVICIPFFKWHQKHFYELFHLESKKV